MNIYVGNLSSDVTQEELQQAFEAHGIVYSVKIITDKYTGEPRGFGFIEMPSKDEAEKAISEMNGKEFMGRTLNVNEAKPKTNRRGGGGRGRERGRGGIPGRGGRGRY